MGMDYPLSGFIIMTCCMCLVKGVTFKCGIGRPDFESPWLPMKANNIPLSTQEVKHGLGTMPQLVEVQVKSTSTQNMGYIFSGVGSLPRDDDRALRYGAVFYVYNEEKVTLAVPILSNDSPLGQAIYTGDGIHHTGDVLVSSDMAMVRVRAWLPSSLPAPDFQSTTVTVKSDTSDVSDTYVEGNHGLGEYPGLVQVRVKLTDGSLAGWMSETVGSSIASYEETGLARALSVIHGFNNETIRVWVPSYGGIFDSRDGSNLNAKATTGVLQMFAWLPSNIKPYSTTSFNVGPVVENEPSVKDFNGDSQDIYVRAWAEATSGINKGFRFPGSGALAYSTSVEDSVCSYGGLLYAYNTTSIRVWRPTGVINGGIICIGAAFGLGTNVQSSLDAKIVVSTWTSVELHTNYWEEVKETCSRIIN